MGAISNCGSNEKGGYHGGTAGDQTGKEYCLKSWYNRPWNVILRHPDQNVRSMISTLAAEAANNDNIGYDQDTRGGMWSQMQKVGYHPSKITTRCNADCSSSTAAIIKGTGYLLNDSKLKSVSSGLTTSTMRSALVSAGFKALTNSKYLTSDACLVAGDVLLLESGHAAIWVSDNPTDTSGIDDGGESSSTTESFGVGSYTYVDYVVKSGDTIYSIAKKYNTTAALIMFINNLTSTELVVGTTLKIPTTNDTLANANSGTNPVTKQHTSGVLVYKPTIEAEFYTEQGALAAVSTTGLNSATDFDNDIISINTVRNMGQDCPTFTINLVWRRDWYHAISSNDLVIIRMQRPPESKQVVFVGLVDDIRKTTDYSSGQPQRSVQVTGRGLNKALVNFDVGLIENVSVDVGTGFFADLTNLVSLDSYDAIRLVLSDYIGKAIKYTFADGSTFEGRYRYDGNHHEHELLVDYENYTTYNGSLWNFIKELTNSPFNETYWEVTSGNPTLIHRRTPFNKEDWIALIRHTIQDLDIVSDNTGRSDLETYTLYSVTTTLGDETLVNMYMPLWYPPFYSKYGITQLTVNTIYQTWGQSSETDGTTYSNSDAATALFEELFNFNIKNNIMSNGTITVKGKASYKVGERVIIESDNMEYYVESVTHNFNCYGGWTTQLGVTRGIEPENRFTPPWGSAEEMTPATFNAIIQQTSGEDIDWANLPEIVYPSEGDVSPENNGNNDDTNSTVPANLGSVAKSVYAYVTENLGLNKAAACAILANMEFESGFKLTALGDNGTSYGLCQWHNERWTNLKRYCSSNNVSINSVEGQMGYLASELKKGGYSPTWNALKNAENTKQGAYNAAYTWCVNFEVPANKYTEAVKRGNTAKNKYFPSY